MVYDHTFMVHLVLKVVFDVFIPTNMYQTMYGFTPSDPSGLGVACCS